MFRDAGYRLDRAKYIVEDEFQKLLKVSKGNDRNYLLFVLCGNLGLRVGELVNIRTRDIDTKHSLIRIRTLKQKKDKGVIDEMTLTEGLTNLLSAYIKKHKLNPDDHLFQSEKGPLSKRGAQWLFDLYAGRCGLKIKGEEGRKGRGIHCLRHLQGIILTKATKDPRIVSKLLRHRSLDTSLAYTHIIDEKKIREKAGTIL